MSTNATIISFASPKGGVGKTTSCMALAQVLAHKGGRVSILEADNNAPFGNWAKERAEDAHIQDSLPQNLTITSGLTEKTLMGAIKQAATDSDFVLIDLEGSANQSMVFALGRSDLVIIPMRDSFLDANEGVRVPGIIEDVQEMAGRNIAYGILFTMTRAVGQSKEAKQTIAAMGDHPQFPVSLPDVAALKTLFQVGETLYEQTINNKTKRGIEAAEAYAEAVLAALDNPDSLKGDMDEQA